MLRQWLAQKARAAEAVRAIAAELQPLRDEAARLRAELQDALHTQLSADQIGGAKRAWHEGTRPAIPTRESGTRRCLRLSRPLFDPPLNEQLARGRRCLWSRRRRAQRSLTTPVHGQSRR
jgi:hypothetical protein